MRSLAVVELVDAWEAWDRWAARRGWSSGEEQAARRIEALRAAAPDGDWLGLMRAVETERRSRGCSVVEAVQRSVGEAA